MMGQPAIELVGPSDVDRARVALVVADAADEGAARVVKAVQHDGVPRVVLVASRFDEAGVVAAVAAGVTAFLRRSDASTNKLVEVIRQTDSSGCQLPEGLLRKAALAPAASPLHPDGVAVGAGHAGAPQAPGSGLPGGLSGGLSGGLAGGAGGHDGVLTCGSSARPMIDLREVRNENLGVHLDDREAEVLRLVADGLDTSDIAEHLSYSESTIKGVLAKLMTRLEARNRCHAVAIVVREGLI